MVAEATRLLAQQTMKLDPNLLAALALGIVPSSCRPPKDSVKSNLSTGASSAITGEHASTVESHFGTEPECGGWPPVRMPPKEEHELFDVGGCPYCGMG